MESEESQPILKFELEPVHFFLIAALGGVIGYMIYMMIGTWFPAAGFIFGGTWSLLWIIMAVNKME